MPAKLAGVLKAQGLKYQDWVRAGGGGGGVRIVHIGQYSRCYVTWNGARKTPLTGLLASTKKRHTSMPFSCPFPIHTRPCPGGAPSALLEVLARDQEQGDKAEKLDAPVKVGVAGPGGVRRVAPDPHEKVDLPAPPHPLGGVGGGEGGRRKEQQQNQNESEQKIQDEWRGRKQQLTGGGRTSSGKA